MTRAAAAAALAVALATPAAVDAAAARARLYAVPNPVRTGKQTVAVGRGFCARKACAAITISLAGVRVARVRARRNGSFAIRLVARVPPGTYVLRARQGRVTATSRLHVALGK